MMERRGFFATIVTFACGLLGIRQAKATGQTPACPCCGYPDCGHAHSPELKNPDWLKPHLDNLRRRFGDDALIIGQVNCGNGNCPPGPANEGYRVFLYTEHHAYRVTVKPNYLGCVAWRLYPEPGETWTRGNDLADGKPTVETWLHIMEDIVAYEICIPSPEKHTEH